MDELELAIMVAVALGCVVFCFAVIGVAHMFARYLG